MSKKEIDKLTEFLRESCERESPRIRVDSDLLRERARIVALLELASSGGDWRALAKTEKFDRYCYHNPYGGQFDPYAK